MAKQIPLKTIGSKEVAGDPFIDYREQLKGIVSSIPRARRTQGLGLASEDIPQICKIVRMLDEAKDAIVLEEPEYKFVADRVNTFDMWAIPHANIATFLEDVAAAKTVDLNKKK